MLTFVIPTASYHSGFVEEAVASCLNQTLLCQVIVVYDHERRGAGWARNRGLEHVTTPFTAFLDADDTLDPCFAEKTLRAWDGKRYVYAGWFTDKPITAPCKPWSGNGESHIITTLLPTQWVKAIGGFREDIQAEDTEFYWHITRSGLCGKRLDEPLVQYRKGGQRSQLLHDDPDRDAILKRAIEAYERLPMPCNGCGENVQFDTPPAGEQQAGDVLAEALWMGNRSERGRATGRIYPRTGNHKTLWIAPEDVQARPDLFRVVQADLPPIITEDGFAAFRNQYRDAMGIRQAGRVRATDEFDPLPVLPTEAKPPQGGHAGVGRVMRLYQQTN